MSDSGEPAETSIDASPIQPAVNYASPIWVTPKFPIYAVRISETMQVSTMDGKPIGGPDMAQKIIDGFNRITPEAVTVDDDLAAETVLDSIRRGRAG